MARSVYVLGAGFSHNFNRDMFPLVRNFLKTAKANFRYVPEQQHTELAFLIYKYFHNDESSDIERVLSFLSTPSLEHRTTRREHRSILYDELVEIIVGVLSDASKSEAESQEVRKTYDRFAAHLSSKETTVITFNYDLLIDNLLMQTGQWHRYDGYGVNIPMVDDAMPTPRHTFIRQPTPRLTLANVSLLKLHGSINWGTPTIHDHTETIYQIPVGEGISMDDFVVQTDLGSPFTLYFKPVIIPPILDKTFWLRHPAFKVLWNMAMEAIDDADSITFIGYSLPVTDFMAEFMFRQAINLRSSETRILVVDPNASGLRQRYLDIFGSAPILDISFKDCDFVSYANEWLPED
jgi:hypothetical protein